MHYIYSILLTILFLKRYHAFFCTVPFNVEGDGKDLETWWTVPAPALLQLPARNSFFLQHCPFKVIERNWKHGGLDLRLSCYSCLPTGHKEGLMLTMPRRTVPLNVTGDWEDLETWWSGSTPVLLQLPANRSQGGTYANYATPHCPFKCYRWLRGSGNMVVWIYACPATAACQPVTRKDSSKWCHRQRPSAGFRCRQGILRMRFAFWESTVETHRLVLWVLTIHYTLIIFGCRYLSWKDNLFCLLHVHCSFSTATSKFTWRLKDFELTFA
jgi:hypothetical protein